MTKKDCLGCYYDFYNGKNDIGVKECWHFKHAKLIQRKEVHINQRPPWNQEPKLLPNSYSRPKYVYVRPEQTQ